MQRLTGVSGSTASSALDERTRGRHFSRYQVAVGQQKERVGVVGLDLERRFQIVNRVLDPPAAVVDPAAQLQS